MYYFCIWIKILQVTVEALLEKIWVDSGNKTKFRNHKLNIPKSSASQDKKRVNLT